MANIVNLNVSERDITINPRQLRREGKIPATVYGKGMDSYSISLEKKLFTQLYNDKNLQLLNLVKNGQNHSVLLKHVQSDPLSREILNVEFLQIKDDQKVTLSIPFILENESPAVKTGGVLLQFIDEIEVECFPKDIPDKIVYDISKIESVDVSVTIGELEYPKGVVPLLSSDTPVVKVATTKEESAETTQEVTTAEEVKVEA